METQSTVNPNNYRESKLSCFSPGVNPRKVALVDKYGLGDSLLDVGCGNGMYPLVTRRKFNRILQIDIADRRSAEAHALPIRLMDAAAVSDLAESYDTVIAFDIMEHLDDDLDFARKIRRRCTGCFIGSVPSDNDSQLRAIGLTHVHHVDKTHRREYSKDSLVDVLNAAGFSNVLVIPQWNEGLLAAPHALRTPSISGRVCARALMACLKFLCFLGVFRNESISDWFFVAR
jgi:SAM-dependent methyltransferase